MLTWPMFSSRTVKDVFLFTVLFLTLGVRLFSGTSDFRLGRDRLFSEQFYLIDGKRIGFFGNRTTRDTLDRLIDDSRVEVGKIFVPEHGLDGSVTAGAAVDDGSYRGISVLSAYAPGKRKIDPEQLADLDCLVFEIQDIGNRHYTYLTTLYLQMTACAQAGIPFILLDRPNGGGDMVEGPLLEGAYQSYIGLFGPNAHGMTQGELARLFLGEGDLLDGDRYDRQGEYAALDDLELHVVEMVNYEREKGIWQKGFSEEDWISTSPNIPTPLSALCYKGNGLFDGYEIREIVSHYRRLNLVQFQDIQLPRMKEKEELLYFIDRCYENWDFPGLQLEPIKNEETGNWDIIHFCLTDKGAFHSTLSTLALLYTWEELYYPGEETGFFDRDRFDKAMGNGWVSRIFAAEELIPFEELAERIGRDEESFRLIRADYLIYY
ncbi:MAG: DUF1343 domain-containing protein [Spirochaetales bacterium]|nr:DUF1343 domain-containing protein [Spirochaetales bacterium]